MKTVKVTGKTIEEALDTALSQLNTDLSNVEYTVLEQPSKGFLGIIGAKPALLEVSLKEEEEIEEEQQANNSIEKEEQGAMEEEMDKQLPNPTEEAHSFLLQVIEKHRKLNPIPKKSTLASKLDPNFSEHL